MIIFVSFFILICFCFTAAGIVLACYHSTTLNLWVKGQPEKEKSFDPESVVLQEQSPAQFHGSAVKDGDELYEEKVSSSVQRTTSQFLGSATVKDGNELDQVKAITSTSSIDWNLNAEDGTSVSVYQIGGQTCIECRLLASGNTGLDQDVKMQLASHEAGHAYVAFLLEVPVTKITLLPDGHLLGYTLLEFETKPAFSGDDRATYVTILWAGREAERKLRRKTTSMFKSDKMAIIEAIEPMGSEFGLSDDDALWAFKAESEKFKGMKDDDKYVFANKCKLKARELIERNAAALEALASMLAECNEIVGEANIKCELTKLQQQYKTNT